MCMIPITQERINELEELSIFKDGVVNQYIYDMTKNVLLNSMRRDDGCQFDEVGLYIDISDTNRASHYSLGKEGVLFTSGGELQDFLDGTKEYNAFFIHNHPNNSPISYSDIWNILFFPEVLGVLAVGNSQNTYYLIKKVGQGYDKLHIELYKEFNVLFNAYKGAEREKKFNNLWNHILENPFKYGLVFGGYENGDYFER